MTDTILNVKDLSSFYKGSAASLLKRKSRRQILKQVSFSMEKGEILGLVGESGSGKSTLAKVLLGMVGDYTGEIQMKTENVQMIFQDPYGSLNPSKKIGWILQEPLRMKGGFTKAEREEKVKEMLKKVGLDQEVAARYPRQLSGGQRQRVCIAAALMLSPGLIIADEPVSALDVTIQAQVIELLMELQKEMGLSILFISHDLRVVYQMCDRVMIMQKGEIVEEGTTEKVYFSPEHEYTRTLLQAVNL